MSARALKRSAQETAEALATAIEGGDVEAALSTTCGALRAGALEVVEQTWIASLSSLGERDVSSWLAWGDTCLRLHNLLSANEIHSRDALTVTTALTLLYRDAALRTRYGKRPIDRLRAEARRTLPESSSLSADGQTLFCDLLPVDVEERVFAERIISGFTALLAGVDTSLLLSDRITRVRCSAEYVLRKNYCVTLPRRWPAPSGREAVSGDIVWMLWGLMLKFCEDTVPQRLPEIKAAWSLFGHGYLPGLRTQRVGLLLGGLVLILDTVGYRGRREPASPWEASHEEILKEVEQRAEEIWTWSRPAPPPREAGSGSEPDALSCPNYLPGLDIVPRHGTSGHGMPPGEPLSVASLANDIRSCSISGDARSPTGRLQRYGGKRS